MKGLQRKIVDTVSCSFCGAPLGKNCSILSGTGKGQKSQPHAPRHKDYINHEKMINPLGNWKVIK